VCAAFSLFEFDVGLPARRTGLSQFDSPLAFESSETAEHIASAGQDDRDQEQEEQSAENHAE
jgi:hypothetical protein